MAFQDPKATGRARAMRHVPTEAEKKFWSRVRSAQLGSLRFRRQRPIGPYIVDFVCIEAKLVIELDGGQHNESKADATRDAYLKAQGWRVLRFWNNEVLDNIEAVLEQILAEIKASA